MNLAYLTTSFGTPSHTFIRREIREFNARNIPVSLYGVRPDPSVAVDAHDLDEQTSFLYPVSLVQVLLCNLFFATRFAHKYWPTLFECLLGNNGSLKNRLMLSYHLMLSTVHAKKMRAEGITHIHAHFLNVATSITMFCSRLTGIPYSVTVHSAGEKDLPHVIAIPMKLKYAQHLLMISQFNIDYYDALHPCRDKSSVVRCGMNIEEFDVRELVEHKPDEALKLLAVGRFVEKKGFRYLVEAAAKLKEKGFNFNVEILGSGPLDDELKELAEQLQVGDVLKFPGHASTAEVKEKMAASHAVVVPSVTSQSGEMEGIPVVIMEGMATGVPVIASAHSGIPELVRDDTGVLVPEKDAQALANAIEHFKPNQGKIDDARQLIETQFNIAIVVDQRLQLFS